LSFTIQQYGVFLAVPAGGTQLAIPIFYPTNFGTSGNVNVGPVPSLPSTLQPAAFLYTELVGFGPTGFCVLRHQLASPTPPSDSFATSVYDPPVAMVTPNPALSTQSLAITATLPSGMPTASTFLHLRIHDAGSNMWHLFAPVSGAMTTINTPAQVFGGPFPKGTYTVEVNFVGDFSIPGGSVQAALSSDYSQLIRPISAMFSQSSISITIQ
jgi:hypothetical protein